MVHCHFIEPQTNIIVDTGLAVFYKAPYSYTGEDVAEFFLHGNALLIRKFLASLLDTGLLRLARPGEFTKRSYLNQKINLTQAQAVNQIIQARNEWELKIAQKNLRGEGELDYLCKNIREALLNQKALLEAEIDFSIKELEPEENIISIEERKKQIAEIKKNIQTFLIRAEQSEKLRVIQKVVIVGVPNAGKSSLFNNILGWERNIVSKKPGTTRDFISEEIQIEGLALHLIDTAGLRELGENIDDLEIEGMNKAKELFKKSDLILHLIDGEQQPYLFHFDFSSIPVINVINKIELPQANNHFQNYPDALRFSCFTNEGLENLKSSIVNILSKGLNPSQAVILEENQSYHLNKVLKILERILELLNIGAPDEIVGIELAQALTEIGSITYEVDHEEVLGKIFSMFCIGK